MLRYEKNQFKPSSEKLQKDRLIEKAVSRFTRKIELMVEAKLPLDHIMGAAATYGLDVSDFTDKIKSYLKLSADENSSEQESKVQKKSQAKSETKKAVKSEVPGAKDSDAETSEA